MIDNTKYFLPYQIDWHLDKSPLRLCQKGRQIGMTHVDAFDSVCLVAPREARLDVFVSSRDEETAKLYLVKCKRWAKILNIAAEDIGMQVINNERDLSAFTLRFANGRCIYSLSSNPDAIASRSGHVKLDEFALHADQRELYRVAKPVIQWGGTLSIMSTHRGNCSVFNGLVRDIREKSNPMGWSLHTIPVQRAVDEGLVEKINAATGRTESREAWLARQRDECIDEEQWLQEYCCIPADDNAAFITYDMITSCEYPTGYVWEKDLADCVGPLYVGVDVGRVKDLTVILVAEKLGDVFYTRCIIVMKGQTFDAQEHKLYGILALPQVQRCCIDETGIGRQFAERAQSRFGQYKVEAISFTGAVKEELAYPVRAAFEDRTVRIPCSDQLRADLRGIKKDTTAAGNIRFTADAGANGHSDRFWALALSLHAGKQLYADNLIFTA